MYVDLLTLCASLTIHTYQHLIFFTYFDLYRGIPRNKGKKNTRSRNRKDKEEEEGAGACFML